MGNRSFTPLEEKARGPRIIDNAPAYVDSFFRQRFEDDPAYYLYALGRQKLIWPVLGRTHPTRQSPHIACYVQAATAIVVIIAFAIADPYTGMYVWATGLGAVGIILLQTLASIAVFAFFRRNNVDKRVWHTFLAPALSIIGLATFAFVALSNFDLLVGSPGPIAIIAMSAVLVLAAVAGSLRALWLRRHDPGSYQRIGAVEDQPVS